MLAPSMQLAMETSDKQCRESRYVAKDLNIPDCETIEDGSVYLARRAAQ